MSGDWAHAVQQSPKGVSVGPSCVYHLYVRPVGNVARRHGVRFGGYPDDVQPYLRYCPRIPTVCWMLLANWKDVPWTPKSGCWEIRSWSMTGRLIWWLWPVVTVCHVFCVNAPPPQLRVGASAIHSASNEGEELRSGIWSRSCYGSLCHSDYTDLLLPPFKIISTITITNNLTEDACSGAAGLDDANSLLTGKSDSFGSFRWYRIMMTD